MSCSINADNGAISGITGIRTTADNTGNLALQSNGVTLLTATTANTISVSNVATLSISGATSGAVALAVPAVAGTNTVTIAAQTGTLNAAGPAFSAYASAAQSMATSTATKFQLNIKTFDTNNNFDSTTNYRFTPTVAGYYQINGCFGVAASSGLGFVSIYKNGSEYKRGVQNSLISSGSLFVVADVIYFNGSTDYIELYGQQTSGSSQNNLNGSSLTYMSGCLVRGA